MTQSKITYYQQVTYCGKSRCRRCREGIGHGPYWYAYQMIDGRTARRYIGKNLPPDVETADLSSAKPYVASGEEMSLLSLSPAATDAVIDTIPLTLASPASEEAGFPSTIISPASDNPVLRIKTYGQFSLEQRLIQRNDQRSWRTATSARWRKQSVRLLLGYLLCMPQRKASVAQVVQTLWPQSSAKEAMAHLLQTVKALRQVLLQYPQTDRRDGANRTPPLASSRADNPTREIPNRSSDFAPGHSAGQENRLDERIRYDGNWIMLAGQDLIWVDIDEFEQLVQRLEHADQQMTAADYEATLRHAIALGRGEFLPELRSVDWVQQRAVLLRSQWCTLSLRLADYYCAHDQDANALATLNSLLQVEPLYEVATQLMMVILFRQQRRPEAINVYRHFTTSLRQERHTEPAAETQAIYEALRTGDRLPTHLHVAPFFAGASSVASSSSKQASQPLQYRNSAGFSDAIGRANQSILVGRESELAMMRAMLYDIRETARLQLVGTRHAGDVPLDTQRQPQFLLLHGVAGIGKTRLAEEIAREAQSTGWTVVWSRQYEQESGIPYRIWTDAIRKLFTMERDFDVFSSLSNAAIHVLSTLPGLIDVLPFETLDSAPPPQIFSPENAQFRLYSVISDLLKSISLQHPLLLVLDDIQYSDASSHQLLGHLARQLTGYPVALFSTCRDNDHSKDFNRHLRKLILEMKREHTIKELSISPLSTEQIEQLITSLSSLPEESVRLIQDRAAGNPFFAEELTRWSFTPNVPLPQTVSDALRYRMESLSGECSELLKHAAILGGSFDFSLICMMETDQQASDDDSVLTLLEEAQDADVVMEEASGSHIVYHFWHPLVANYLYEQMSAVRRMRWHKKAAQALLTLYADREEVVAAQVMLHLDKAGDDPLQVAYYAELAGDNAFVLPAYAEAALYYQKAVDCLESLPAQSQPSARERLLALLERLAECSKNSGSYEKATDIYMRLLALRRQVPVPESAQDVSREAQVQALLWDEVCWTWRYRGDIQRAWVCCQQGETILRESLVETGPARARLYYTRSNLYLSEGQFEQTLQYAQEALTLFETQPGLDDAASIVDACQREERLQGDRKRGKTSIQCTLDGDPVNLCRLHRHLGVIAVVNGQLQQALDHQRTALESFEQYNELRQVGNILSNIGYIQLKMGQYQQAHESLQRALDLAERIGDGPLVSLVMSNCGELNAATEQFAEAAKAYARALKLNDTFGDREYMSRWNVGLAYVMIEEGRLHEAAKLIKQALLVARVMKNQPCIGKALVMLSMLRIAQAQVLPKSAQQRTVLLAHAQKDVQRALLLKVEAETRLKGEMALAHIAYERGDIPAVQAACEFVITAAQEYILIVADAHHLLACLP
jgi:Predicted ATPase